MLFILTGNMQIGKTRWLLRTLEQLSACGVFVCGLVTPGVWIEHEGVCGAPSTFEKLGIDALLLPQREQFSFARKAHEVQKASSDGARGKQAHAEDQSGKSGEWIQSSVLPSNQLEQSSQPSDRLGEAGRFGFSPTQNQSQRAGLGWNIPDEALSRINKHFDELGVRTVKTSHPRLLVVDEFGPLELIKNGGLVSAVRMIDAGPSEQFPHALLIVREALLACAHERFACAWNGQILDISPDDEAFEALSKTLFGSMLLG